ncbi:MAG: hypothetical protein ACYC1G_10280, partial [Thiobacillus sp.]
MATWNFSTKDGGGIRYPAHQGGSIPDVGTQLTYRIYKRNRSMMLKKLSLAIALVLAGSSAFAAGTSFE